MKNTENDNEECKSPWSNTLWMDSFKEGITAKLIENCSHEEISDWELIIYSNGEVIQTLHFNKANELDQYIEKENLKKNTYDIVPFIKEKSNKNDKKINDDATLSWEEFWDNGLPPMVEGGCMKELENSTINEDYSEYVKYSIQVKGTRTMPSEYFKTEQEANEYATKIGLKQNEYSVIQWIREPYIEDQ